MPKNETKGDSALQEKTRIHVAEPRQFKVIFHNDDMTTMDFVINVLVEVFHKQEAEAMSLMLKVHHEDQAVVGIYSFDMARTLQQAAINMARAEGFPLNITVEPA